MYIETNQSKKTDEPSSSSPYLDNLDRLPVCALGVL